MLVELDVAAQDNKQKEVSDEDLEELNIELEEEGEEEEEYTETKGDTTFKTISLHYELIRMVQPYNDDESLVFFGDKLPPMHCKHSRKGVHNKINQVVNG